MKRRWTAPLNQVQLSGTNGGTQAIYGLYDDCLYLSTGHPRGADGQFHSGSPFLAYHRGYAPAICQAMDWKLNGIEIRTQPYIGTFSTTPPAPLTGNPLAAMATKETADAFSYGATAWNRMRPGTTEFSAVNFLRELGDIPTLPYRLFNRLRTIRAAGSEYLNVQFGWLPFLSDLRKFYQTYRKVDKLLAQMVRDNGRGIHRHREIANSTSSTVVNTGGAQPFNGWYNSPPFWTGGTGSVAKTTQITERVWSCGNFTYYIPDIGSSQWTRRAKNVLFGVNVTPEALWNAIPWTWLLDWGSNIGDVMSNMSPSAVGDVTANYAFVMRTRSIVTTYEGSAWASGRGSKGGITYIPEVSVYMQASDEALYKTRVVASPFGFGVHFSDLSARQLGIAAALGISRWA